MEDELDRYVRVTATVPDKIRAAKTPGEATEILLAVMRDEFDLDLLVDAWLEKQAEAAHG